MPEANSPPLGLIVALVGAESTGKSTLAQALAALLPGHTGWRCVWVPEYLREWCDARGRTPQQEEQAAIAAEQARRIERAAAEHDLVLADTTPLMTAVYHHQVFGDSSLDAAATEWQRRCHLTLLTALDLPWQADGLQRDGPQVREPVDARLRHLLVSRGLNFSIVSGSGTARTEHALDTLIQHLRHMRRLPGAEGLISRLLQRDEARARQEASWQWLCDCDVAECEHAAFKPRASASLQRR